MLSEALRRRQAEWEALLEEARAYAHRVREALGEARVYLFGSVARGEFNLESDLRSSRGLSSPAPRSPGRLRPSPPPWGRRKQLKNSPQIRALFLPRSRFIQERETSRRAAKEEEGVK
jgi:hypothetical protein